MYLQEAGRPTVVRLLVWQQMKQLT